MNPDDMIVLPLGKSPGGNWHRNALYLVQCAMERAKRKPRKSRAEVRAGTKGHASKLTRRAVRMERRDLLKVIERQPAATPA